MCKGSFKGGPGGVYKPHPIMIKFLPILHLKSAQKVIHYAQQYAHIISSMPANFMS